MYHIYFNDSSLWARPLKPFYAMKRNAICFWWNEATTMVSARKLTIILSNGSAVDFCLILFVSLAGRRFTCNRDPIIPWKKNISCRIVQVSFSYFDHEYLFKDGRDQILFGWNPFNKRVTLGNIKTLCRSFVCSLFFRVEEIESWASECWKGI